MLKMVLIGIALLVVTILSMGQAAGGSGYGQSVVPALSMDAPQVMLSGTVNISRPTSDIMVNQVQLQNLGSSESPTVTVVVTNFASFQSRYSPISSSWTCGNPDREPYACSTQVGPLAGGEVITLSAEHAISETRIASIVCNFWYALTPPEPGPYQSGPTCWERNLSPQAVAVLQDIETDERVQIRLDVSEPPIIQVCTCLVATGPPPPPPSSVKRYWLPFVARP